MCSRSLHESDRHIPPMGSALPTSGNGSAATYRKKMIVEVPQAATRWTLAASPETLLPQFAHFWRRYAQRLRPPACLSRKGLDRGPVTADAMRKTSESARKAIPAHPAMLLTYRPTSSAATERPTPPPVRPIITPLPRWLGLSLPNAATSLDHTLRSEARLQRASPKRRVVGFPCLTSPIHEASQTASGGPGMGAISGSPQTAKQRATARHEGGILSP